MDEIYCILLNLVSLQELYLYVFKPNPIPKPLHIINVTLNLVGGKKLAWQNRKAESFSISPLHSGSYRVGYRDSRVYGLNKNKQAISLGTAAAISGAAVSPNMGYYSSAFVTFLLALFNLRLGWWRLGIRGRRETASGDSESAGSARMTRPDPISRRGPYSQQRSVSLTISTLTSTFPTVATSRTSDFMTWS